MSMTAVGYYVSPSLKPSLLVCMRVVRFGLKVMLEQESLLIQRGRLPRYLDHFARGSIRARQRDPSKPPDGLMRRRPELSLLDL